MARTMPGTNARTDDSTLERREAPPPATAPIADPGPLGLAGFALTTFCLSVFNAGIMSRTLEPVVLPVALFYGGIAQLLAGMWEFRKNNTFGALAFTSYGAFWLSLAAYIRYIAPGFAKLLVGAPHQATALFLLAWTIFTAYMLIASLRTNGGLIAVFLVLTATFLFLTLGAISNTQPAVTQAPNALTRLGGYLGIITALLAWYMSFAGVTNATWGRSVLPTWPVKK